MLHRIQLQSMSKKQITEKVVATMIAQRAEHYEMHLTGQIAMGRQESFSDVATVSMQTTGSMTRLPRTTKQMLLLDREGRPFTMGANSSSDTLQLIEEQLQKFVSIENRYPAEILLSPLRFLAKGGHLTHYTLLQFNLSIPIRFDRSAYENFLFEVMCRGE